MQETLIRRFHGPTSFIAGDVLTSKDLDYCLTQVPLIPHLEAIHWLTQFTATCGRGEKVVRVRAMLKAIKNPFLVRNYFAF